MNKQLIVLVALLIYVFVKSVIIEPNSLEVVKYEITDYELQGIRVAFLTDFHLKRNDYKRLDKIVNLTRNQKPDIVLLGGDFANGHNFKNMMPPEIMAQKLSLLDAPTYSVLGEHDWWANAQKIKEELTDNGVRVLDNSNIRTYLKGRLVDIVGIADMTSKKPDMQKSFTRTRLPRLVITHNPDVYYSIVDEASMIFAGHTHGGQFILPYSPPLYVNSKFGAEFAYGLIKPRKNQMIISRGLGTSFLPVRFNCKPEIVIVDFVKKQVDHKYGKKRKK